MLKLLPFFGFFFLVSCAQEKKCNCDKIEKRLKELFADNRLAKVDVPKENSNESHAGDELLTVEITVKDTYLFKGNEYSFEDLSPLLDAEMANRISSDRKIKIAGHKDARYESVFKLIAYAQINGVDPVLAYSKK
jgi:biopolymer transport protein ExbD